MIDTNQVSMGAIENIPQEPQPVVNVEEPTVIATNENAQPKQEAPVTEAPQNEEAQKEEETEQNKGTHLYEEKKETVPEYIDFNNDENFAEYKDIFQKSNITKEDYERFKNKILETTTPESFTEELVKAYGENFPKEIELFREATQNIFTPEEQAKMEGYPAEVKSLFVKMANTLARQSQAIKKEYGVTTTTMSVPGNSQIDFQREFDNVTQQIIDGKYSSEDEYNQLVKRRLELATKF